MNLRRAISYRTTLSRIRRRIVPSWHIDPSPFVAAVEGKRGLEIGGPSSMFSDVLPIYSRAASVDNCVFAKETLWGEANGHTIIAEATNLAGISSGTYDFILSCHSLEHYANPIKALKEWQRVTVPGGALILILPNYRYTFDRRRPVTSVPHLLDDYAADRGEDDATHFDEILGLHDLSLHPGGPIPYEQLRSGILDNLRLRCAHHHVFDETNIRGMLEACGFQVHSVQAVKPMHIVSLATM